MEICGNCLHDKEAHTKDGFNFMYCAVCMRLCDIADYYTVHKFSGIIINDLKRIDIHE